MKNRMTTMTTMNPHLARTAVASLPLLGALALLLIFGLWHIQTSPPVWFDGGIVASVAKNLAEHGVYGLQTSPGHFATERYVLTTNHTVILPLSLVFRLFGASVLAARLTMFAYLLATAAIAYLFVRELTDRWIATWSAWLLVTFSPFYGNGKSMLGETPGVCWLLVGLWCWTRAMKTTQHRWAWLLAAGTAIGLCAITKPYFLLALPAVALARIIHGIRSRTLRLKEESLFALPIVAVVAAWFIHTFPFPPSWGSLVHVAHFYLNSYGEQIAPAYILRNALRFVTESTPIHLALMLAVTVLFLMRARPNRWHPALVMLGLFIGASLLWYVKTPGWYRYFYPAHLLVLILMPAAWWRLQIPRLGKAWKRFALVALILIQLIVTIQSRDRFRSDAFFALRDAVQTYAPGKPLFLAHVPEAAFILPTDRLEQMIYIHPTLTLGVNRLEDENNLPEVVVVSNPGEIGVDALEPILREHYRLLWNKSHYRLFEKR